MSVPPKPSGSFDLPDVIINTSAPIDVLIEGRYIPPGTVVTLQLFSLDGADQTLTTSPLQGTLEQSTTSASVTFPVGFTRGYARAVWE